MYRIFFDVLSAYFPSFYAAAVTLPPPVDVPSLAISETMFSELHVMKYGISMNFNPDIIMMASTTKKYLSF